MSNWWMRKQPLFGAVLFRGELPPRPEDFAFLEKLGITVKPPRRNPASGWLRELSHPEWGSAEIADNPELSMPPRELYQVSFLPEADKDAATSARSMLALRMESRHEHVLRDRKTMLRFLRAVMGDDAVAAVDIVANLVWTREALDDELSNDADLDVEAVYSIHAVEDPETGRCYWAHTHGLAEIGGFDFDVFDPSDDACFNIGDLCRALAFSILEGEVRPAMSEFLLVPPHGKVSFVEMATFLAKAATELKERFAGGVDEVHRTNHSVLCEPQSSSLLVRLFAHGSQPLRPSRLLSGRIPENPMFSFSTSASALMAERAVKTYPMLRQLRQEFADFEFPCLVKVGLNTDPRSLTDKEHVWFEVHELSEDIVDGTLVNQPYFVSSLKEGDRRTQPVELISDWVMFTPAGSITPRSAAAARMVRANPTEIRRLMKET